MRKGLDTLHECLAGVCHQFSARPQDGSTGRGRAEQRTGARTSRSAASSQQSARAKNAKIVRLCKTLIVCRLAGPSSAQLCKQEAERRTAAHRQPGRGNGNDSSGPAPCADCALLATTRQA